MRRVPDIQVERLKSRPLAASSANSGIAAAHSTL
jgi:hypothetical protein